jgi:hypothetical protein
MIAALAVAVAGLVLAVLAVLLGVHHMMMR